MLDEIHEDWNSLRDKMEIEIIKKYACQGRFFTITTMCKKVLVAIFYINIRNTVICDHTNYPTIQITLKRTLDNFSGIIHV